MESIVHAHEAQEALIVPAWLNTKQAEIYLGLSRVTLWRLRKAGEIKVASTGRAIRFNRESLDDYMERCTENA